MGKKLHGAEEIIRKLRQAEVLRQEALRTFPTNLLISQIAT